MLNPENLYSVQWRTRRFFDVKGWQSLLQDYSRTNYPPERYEVIKKDGSPKNAAWGLEGKRKLLSRSLSDSVMAKVTGHRITLEELLRSPSILDFGMGWGSLGVLLQSERGKISNDVSGRERIVGVEKNRQLLARVKYLEEEGVYDQIIHPLQLNPEEKFAHVIASSPSPELLYDFVYGVDRLPLLPNGKALIHTELRVKNSGPFELFEDRGIIKSLYFLLYENKP